MKKLTKTELKRILKEHEKWFHTSGKEGSRADLTGADLRGVDLRGVNLSNAILNDAELDDADLGKAGLYGASLIRASLIGADLTGANFFCASLIEANLGSANLTDASLVAANLKDSNLLGANLKDAQLYGANLTGATLNYPIACPESGSFIGYKKVCMPVLWSDDDPMYHPVTYIIKLQIPAKAKRCSATSRKCRCEYAKVLSITYPDGTKVNCSGINHHAYGHNTLYKIGEIVRPDSFDENRWNECSNGIHFFITRKEAVNYLG